MFRFWLFLGSIGFFHYGGFLSLAPKWWPQARVKYDDGHTYNMPIGNAIAHAAATGGEVVHPTDTGQSTISKEKP